MSTTQRTQADFDLAAILAPTSAVERYMEAFIDARPFPRNLREAIRYSLLGPGKRLRPVLVVRSCEAVGGSLDAALPAAAAIEMIHCFSLVHDDLPAMDDDDLRRGRPTLHKHTNEAMAILAGDAMSALAFELLAQKLAPAQAAAIGLELAVATNDMIAGQVYDTLPDFDAAVPPMERLRTIHRNKTGALIRCSCRMGALAAGVTLDSPLLKAITDYAEAIGLMFQVVDDVLDVTQTTEQLGKTAGKDVVQNKLTYPALIGLDASRKEIERLRLESHAALDRVAALAATGKQGVTYLRELCDYMAVRSK